MGRARGREPPPGSAESPGSKRGGGPQGGSLATPLPVERAIFLLTNKSFEEAMLLVSSRRGVVASVSTLALSSRGPPASSVAYSLSGFASQTRLCLVVSGNHPHPVYFLQMLNTEPLVPAFRLSL